jgi:hypothetical protein
MEWILPASPIYTVCLGTAFGFTFSGPGNFDHEWLQIDARKLPDIPVLFLQAVTDLLLALVDE